MCFDTVRTKTFLWRVINSQISCFTGQAWAFPAMGPGLYQTPVQPVLSLTMMPCSELPEFPDTRAGSYREKPLQKSFAKLVENTWEGGLTPSEENSFPPSMRQRSHVPAPELHISEPDQTLAELSQILVHREASFLECAVILLDDSGDQVPCREQEIDRHPGSL